MVEKYNNTKTTKISEICGVASCMMTQLSSLRLKDPQTKKNQTFDPFIIQNLLSNTLTPLPSNLATSLPHQYLWSVFQSSFTQFYQGAE